MDIAAKLRESVSQIPDGEYTAGLRAVVRHIDAAIKHFERAQSMQEDDAFTDAIYRTNQAYEGSLKEAYRVISESNPTKKSLYEIENFLQGNQDLRARVLIQMTRYREDYRNPSTHDYKLDFDESEALLAILSVTAFAKLLVDQIAGKVSFERAKDEIEQASTKIARIVGNDPVSYFQSLSNSLLNFLNKASKEGITERENTAVISAFLSSADIKFENNVRVDSEDFWVEWDISVDAGDGHMIGFDVKSSRGRRSREITDERLSNVAEWLNETGYKFAFLIEGAPRGEKYECTKHSFSSGKIIHRLGLKWD